jgi:hypothetical protein
MAHPRAADDSQAIHARMEELRRERERTPGMETEGRSVQPACRANNDNEIVICLRRLKSLVGQRL